MLRPARNSVWTHGHTGTHLIKHHVLIKLVFIYIFIIWLYVYVKLLEDIREKGECDIALKYLLNPEMGGHNRTVLSSWKIPVSFIGFECCILYYYYLLIFCLPLDPPLTHRESWREARAMKQRNEQSSFRSSFNYRISSFAYWSDASVLWECL